MEATSSCYRGLGTLGPPACIRTLQNPVFCTMCSYISSTFSRFHDLSPQLRLSLSSINEDSKLIGRTAAKDFSGHSSY